MSVSIVIPNYNGFPYLQETMKSVLYQIQEIHEVVVQNGGDSRRDKELLDSIKETKVKVHHEPDSGQYDAVNRAIGKATGEVIGWVNSDDVLLPGAVATVNEIFGKYSDIGVLCGSWAFVNSIGQLVRVYPGGGALPRQLIARGLFFDDCLGCIQQESVFFRRSVWEDVGGIDGELSLAGDFDFWRRVSMMGYEFATVNTPLAAFRTGRAEQRSVKMRDQYKSEVHHVRGRMPMVWRLFSFVGRSAVGRGFLRKLIWSRQTVFVFSLVRQEWTRSQQYVPISMHSFLTLYQMFKAR